MAAGRRTPAWARVTPPCGAPFHVEQKCVAVRASRCGELIEVGPMAVAQQRVGSAPFMARLWLSQGAQCAARCRGCCALRCCGEWGEHVPIRGHWGPSAGGSGADSEEGGGLSSEVLGGPVASLERRSTHGVLRSVGGARSGSSRVRGRTSRRPRFRSRALAGLPRCGFDGAHSDWVRNLRNAAEWPIRGRIRRSTWNTRCAPRAPEWPLPGALESPLPGAGVRHTGRPSRGGEPAVRPRSTPLAGLRSARWVTRARSRRTTSGDAAGALSPLQGPAGRVVHAALNRPRNADGDGGLAGHARGRLWRRPSAPRWGALEPGESLWKTKTAAGCAAVFGAPRRGWKAWGKP